MSSRIVGRVKWFSPKIGFGFITPCSENRDIFVHYTGLRADANDHRYLVQGEYVDFATTQPVNKRHDRIAFDVSGIQGGLLMCDTHNNTKTRKID